ncbi:MAG TPA: LysM domain-containing protein [Deltaproteobacteria bacterium]|nr:LysM domain-containing protein [Deltaproteobacteria bacterium]HPR54002.1 LysM domain-containing protein [Deltaproteobacteria bacterium]HXK46375.1 LysM domain-containing protein [Deltaproteobacteria bacterium]
MKKILAACLVALLLLGCATTKGASDVPDPRKEAMKQGVQSLRQALEALEDEEDEAAAQAFSRALEQFDPPDREMRAVMKGASEQLAKVVDIAGFEYAKKESFALLLIYLDMQTAYADRDAAGLQSLTVKFNGAYQEAVQKTAEEKQKKLEEIGAEIAVKREEIQKTSEPSVLEVYPTIYVVKKGDTLPSIAARHEIYNDSFMWPLIYKANRDQIKDPKVLYTGQDLKVPREVTLEEIIEARREAGAPDPEKIPKDAYTPKGRKK